MPKNNLKASLVRNARVEIREWRRGTIITSLNGRVKANAMLIGEREYTIDPESPLENPTISLRQLRSLSRVSREEGAAIPQSEYDVRAAQCQRSRRLRCSERSEAVRAAGWPSSNEVNRQKQTTCGINPHEPECDPDRGRGFALRGDPLLVGQEAHVIEGRSEDTRQFHGLHLDSLASAIQARNCQKVVHNSRHAIALVESAAESFHRLGTKARKIQQFLPVFSGLW
jgi:hypothetical protein